jgi:hypothetical protein
MVHPFHGSGGSFQTSGARREIHSILNARVGDAIVRFGNPAERREGFLGEAGFPRQDRQEKIARSVKPED